MFPGEYFCRTFFDSGYWPGVGVSSSPPTIPGAEYTAARIRPHYTATGRRFHYTATAERPQYESVEE